MALCSHSFLGILCQFLQRPNLPKIQVSCAILPSLDPKHSGSRLTGVVRAETQSLILSMSAFPAATALLPATNPPQDAYSLTHRHLGAMLPHGLLNLMDKTWVTQAGH